MPELPEVETIVRELISSGVVGCRITNICIYWPRTIANDSPEEFAQSIQGQQIHAINRHGKWLHFALDKHQLYIHLRMTGKFFLKNPKDKVEPHERVRLCLDDGRCLCFEDQRKFGRWKLIRESENIPPIGIDPLSPKFTFRAFKELISKHRQCIKAFLLNQHYLSGLGNIYTDESLWEAHIHPLQRTDALSQANIKELFKAIPLVLQKGIDNTGTTLGNTQANYYSVSRRRGQNQHQLNVFRRQKQPCPRCGSIIQRMVVAQRSTHFCPTCQPLQVIFQQR